MGWQPIETAPKDGKIIRARNGGYFPQLVEWRDGKWMRLDSDVEEVPTHWMNYRVRRCEGCYSHYADPPSKLCPGCQAYAEHRR